MKKKIGFVSSDKPIAKKSLKILKDIYKNVSPDDADIIVELGVDGTVLEYLHKFLKKNHIVKGLQQFMFPKQE